jgi:hypothetical protein
METYTVTSPGHETRAIEAEDAFSAARQYFMALTEEAEQARETSMTVAWADGGSHTYRVTVRGSQWYGCTHTYRARGLTAIVDAETGAILVEVAGEGAHGAAMALSEVVPNAHDYYGPVNKVAIAVNALSRVQIRRRYTARWERGDDGRWECHTDLVAKLYVGRRIVAEASQLGLWCWNRTGGESHLVWQLSNGYDHEGPWEQICMVAETLGIESPEDDERTPKAR